MRFFSRTRNLKILESINKKYRIKRIVQLIVGCLLVAISYNLFLSPNKLVAGGVSGLAILLNYLFKVDESIIILVLNLLLLIASYIFLGKEKTKATAIGSVLFPLFVKLTSDITYYIEIDTSQLLLSAIFI